MEEVWKDILGYEGKYQVSNTGLVKSLPRRYNSPMANREIIMKPSCDKDGYYRVRLYNPKNNSNGKYIPVHRLVALAFVDNPNNYPEVNHKDEVKTNNNASNLEWCTTKYNLTYGHRLDCVIGENNVTHKLTEEQVKEIRKTYKKGDPVYGQSALGKRYGVAHNTIARIVERESWKHLKEE